MKNKTLWVVVGVTIVVLSFFWWDNYKSKETGELADDDEVVYPDEEDEMDAINDEIKQEQEEAEQDAIDEIVEARKKSRIRRL